MEFLRHSILGTAVNRFNSVLEGFSCVLHLASGLFTVGYTARPLPFVDQRFPNQDYDLPPSVLLPRQSRMRLTMSEFTEPINTWSPIVMGVLLTRVCKIAEALKGAKQRETKYGWRQGVYTQLRDYKTQVRCDFLSAAIHDTIAPRRSTTRESKERCTNFSVGIASIVTLPNQ